MIVRAKRKTNYTIMSNKGLTDNNLTWKARGLLAYLLSKPDDWSISERQLADAGPDGREAVRTALKELEGFGYVKREKTRNEKGHIAWVSWISDEPWSDFPTTDKPTADYPTAGKPAADKPAAENPTIISTVVTSTDPTSTEHQSVANATAVAPPAPSLVEQFRHFHDELRTAQNRAEVLRRAYIFCHGEPDAPTHGRLGAFAGKVGSWGMALEAIWGCTSRPANDDILSYLEKSHEGKAKDKRGGRVPMDKGDQRGSYAVEPHTPRAPSSPAAKPPPAKGVVHGDDPWVVTMAELRQAFSGYRWLADLEGSHLQAAGEVADNQGNSKPLYRVLIGPGVDAEWLTRQAGETIRKKLGSVLRKPVLIEIVATIAELEPNP